ncbi:MAG: alpha/beta fold hydrolase [Saezia sp.]
MSNARPVQVPPPSLQQIVSTPMGNISYRAQGKGQPILFLHGLLGSSKAWTFQQNDFADAYQTIAWDAPGYGQSDHVAIDIDAYADALGRLINALCNEPVIILGHSMGGTVASRYAAQHPDKVKKLILSCTHPGYGDPETAPMSEKFEKRMQELKEIGKAAYGLNRARDLLPFPDIPQTVLAYAAEVAAETNPDGLRRATRMLQLADNRPFLPKLTMPVLILTGEKDKVVQPQLKADLLKLTPHEQHIEMPEMAHAPYFQNPTYYNALIRNFISAQ